MALPPSDQAPRLALHVRPAGVDDADLVRTLTRDAYAAWIPLIGREPLPMTADYARAVIDHRVDLLFSSERAVGLIETDRRGDHLLIVNVAVSPDMQGLGLGRRLLDHAEALAAASGLRKLRLYTNLLFERNISLYRRLGYAIDRQEVSSAGATVHMSKRITSPARRRLFLPGAGGDPAFWRPLGDHLPAAWSKHYFGWPGLGRQPPDPSVTAFDDLVALVEAELGDTPCDLLAQSMGGVVALCVVLRNPGRIRRLVLSATSGGVDAANAARLDWRDTYARNFPNAAGWIREVRIDLTQRLGEVACPTLLLWGDNDPISPLEVGERLSVLLPDARLHVTAGGEHDLAHAYAGALAPIVEAHLA